MDNPIDGIDGKLGHGFTSADELEEIEFKEELIDLLKEFKDYFAQEYDEMPGLDQSIVEHRLSIKLGYQPFKQAPRRFNPNILDDIKKETERLLEAKFI